MPHRLKTHLQRHWLKYCYHQGQKQLTAPEEPDPSLIRLGLDLRTRTLEHRHHQYRDKTYNILLCTPPSMAAGVWFSDLAQGLQHTGIQHHLLPAGTKLTLELLSTLRPNVVMGLDHPQSLQDIDLVALRQYKRTQACFRLFIPSREDLFRPQATLQSSDHHRLLQAQSGQIADAYFSLYDSAIFTQFYRPWAESGFAYLSLPQSCNPLEDYPRSAPKAYDWFAATIYNPARLNCTWSQLRPILKHYKGLWLDGNWGFGEPVVPPEDMPTHYAQAKISLAPLIDFLRQHPAELSHRVFEAAACGAFQLTSLSPLTRQFFSSKALIAVDHPSDFIRAFEYWLPHKEERLRVSEEALKEVYQKHTLFHRIDQLVDFLDRQHPHF